MNKLLLIVFFFCFLFLPGCSQMKSHIKQFTPRKYLTRTNISLSNVRQSAHIEINQVFPKISEGFNSNNIDDRDIISRSNFSKEQQIVILAEYLTFIGDTTPSDKMYLFSDGTRLRLPKDIKEFTIEIEALYSFSRMLTYWLPPIEPVLVNRNTGERILVNRKTINEIYKLHLKWFKENRRAGFKNISLPLAGSPYAWLGEDKGMEPYLKKSL